MGAYLMSVKVVFIKISHYIYIEVMVNVFKYFECTIVPFITITVNKTSKCVHENINLNL